MSPNTKTRWGNGLEKEGRHGARFQGEWEHFPPLAELLSSGSQSTEQSWLFLMLFRAGNQEGQEQGSSPGCRDGAGRQQMFPLAPTDLLQEGRTGRSVDASGEAGNSQGQQEINTGMGEERQLPGIQHKNISEQKITHSRPCRDSPTPPPAARGSGWSLWRG